MAIDGAIIGGTGTGDLLLAHGGTPVHVPTAEGLLRGRVVGLEGLTVFVTNRHSAGHKVPPHRVNYKALALGVRAIGAPVCFATAAVGSLDLAWSPGELVACGDFLDMTARFPTLFDRRAVHTDFSEPFDPDAVRAMVAAGESMNERVHSGGVYLCNNGPRYETPEEIRLAAKLGGQLVGMTAASEAILFREANVPYACLAVVTNFAAGISPTPLDHLEVEVMMKARGPVALNVIVAAIATMKREREAGAVTA